VESIYNRTAAGATSVFAALAPVLRDPSALSAEVLAALDVLLLLVGAQVAPLREWTVGARPHPNPPPPPPRRERGGAAGDPPHARGVIRPWEVAEVPAPAGEGATPPLASPPTLALSLTVSARRASCSRLFLEMVGEEGRSRVGGVVLPLIWRVVEDPDVRVQSLCMEVLTTAMELPLLGAPGLALPDAPAWTELLFDRYLPWLLSAFEGGAGLVCGGPPGEWPPPVEAMKALEGALCGRLPAMGLGAGGAGGGVEPLGDAPRGALLAHLRRAAPAVGGDVLQKLWGGCAPSPRRVPRHVLAARALVTETLLEVLAKIPLRGRSLVTRYELHGTVLYKLCAPYNDGALLLLGVKFLRALLQGKDTVHITCVPPLPPPPTHTHSTFPSAPPALERVRAHRPPLPTRVHTQYRPARRAGK
jgi:hypothetical protein